MEPIAAALPREFQRAFTPVQRQQVIRVEFAPDETPPPLFAKIKLRPVHTVESWIQRFSRRLDDVAAAVSRGRAWLGV